MFRLFFILFIFSPFLGVSQCNYDIQAQGNVLLGTDSLLCHGYLTQININNISGSAPFICQIENNINSQLIQIDSTYNIFYNFNPIPAGNYLITIIDSLGVSCSESIIIYEPPSLYATVQVHPQSYCFIDGSIEVNVFGGTEGYITQISGNSPPFINLPAGYYSLQVEDENNCNFNIDSILLPQTPTLQGSLNMIDMSLNITGGEEPIGVIWPTGETGLLMNQDLCPGSYQVLIDDISDCPPIVIDFNIDSIEAIIDVSLAGVIDVSGGNPPYSFEWNTGASDSIVSGLCAGSYEITISDVANCTQIYYFEIDTLSATLNTEASMLENISGGTPPYSYEWFTNSQSIDLYDPQVFGLCDGYHEVYLSDFHECTKIYGWEILPLESGLQWDDINCEESDFDGSISIAPSGGTPPYNTFWNNNNLDLVDLEPGIQYLSIEDQNSCQLLDSVIISEIKPECLYNVISPHNLDGINDDWSIEPSFLYNETTVNIYNRWGKKIFTSVGYQEPFNGKNKNGKLLQQGVYFYSIQLQESANPIRGSLTIY